MTLPAASRLMLLHCWAGKVAHVLGSISSTQASKISQTAGRRSLQMCTFADESVYVYQRQHRWTAGAAKSKREVCQKGIQGLSMYKEENLTSFDHCVQRDFERLTKAQRTASLRIQVDWSCSRPNDVLGSCTNPLSWENLAAARMYTMAEGRQVLAERSLQMSRDPWPYHEFRKDRDLQKTPAPSSADLRSL